MSQWGFVRFGLYQPPPPHTKTKKHPTKQKTEEHHALVTISVWLGKSMHSWHYYITDVVIKPFKWSGAVHSISWNSSFLGWKCLPPLKYHISIYPFFVLPPNISLHKPIPFYLFKVGDQLCHIKLLSCFVLNFISFSCPVLWLVGQNSHKEHSRPFS